MSKNSKVFAEVKTLTDFKAVIEDNIDYLSKSCFEQTALQAALTGLNSLPEEQHKPFLGFVHHLDKRLSVAGNTKGNSYHKIPAVMAGFIYYRYFPETIAGLDYDELGILARHSIPRQLSFYGTAVETYGKELLCAIITKDQDFMFCETFMHLADEKMADGNTNEEITEYITNKPLVELKKEAFDYEERTIQEVGQYL